MKRQTNRNPQKGDKPVILIIERRQRERHYTEDVMRRRLTDCEINVVDFFSPDSFLICNNYIDIIVITTHFREKSGTIRRVISDTSIVCPEAQFIIFADATAEDPKDVRARTIVPNNNYEPLATAIREKLALVRK
jgi:hypothetical protein